MRFSTEFKVGVFTLFSLVVIGYMFFMLNPDAFRGDRYEHYTTVVPNASGIISKTHIKTNGVIVGSVGDISLEANNTRINLNIDKDVKIPKGSTIQIREKGLLGDVFLEILRSDDFGEYIEAGSFIPPARNQVNISSLLSVADSIGSDIKELTYGFAQALGGNEGALRIKSIVEDLQQISASSRELIEQNRADIRSMVENVSLSALELRKIVASHGQDLGEIIVDVRDVSRHIKSISGQLAHLLRDENREKVELMLASLDRSMENVERSSQSIRLVANKIEQGEGSLGKLINDERTASEIESTIKDLRELINPASKLQVAVDYQGEFRRDQSNQHYFNTYLRTRPDKFFLLGFTDVRETDKLVRREVFPHDEPDQRATASEEIFTQTREDKSLRFNIQYGKRWHNIQVRFGLFETTGGIASDLFLFDDHLRLTAEMFDWDSKSRVRRVAHVKTYLNILFLKHLKFVAGLDDLTRIKPDGSLDTNLNYFLGAGLNFDDNDLKSMFGLAAAAL